MRPKFIASAILAALVIGSAPAFAQNADDGEVLFRRHCAVCHGMEAVGNGPMAPVLLLPPANLTTLKKRNEGDFPRLRVIARIDGRDPLVSHGSDMPVYGWFFEGKAVSLPTASGQPILTTEPIVDIVAWLEAHQE